MNALKAITRLLTDPPPAMAFEVTEAGVAMARMGPKPEIRFQPLKAGVVSVSPVRDNVLVPDDLAAAVRSAAPQNGSRKRRDIALILPDYSARITVLDFDHFPSDARERLSLVRFRLKKSVPFDVESAAVSCWPQPAPGKKVDVVAVAAPLEIVSRYEAPFRAAGLNPGFVITSSLAALDLVEAGAPTAVAKLSGRAFTVMVVEKGTLKLVRCLELSEGSLAEAAAELFPTLVYVEDQFGGKAQKLMLCGFGEQTEEARRMFAAELGVEVEPLRSPFGIAGPHNAGLMGYLKSVAA